MNRTEFALRIATKMSITHREAKRFMAAFESSVTETLQENDSILLNNFGALTIWEQKERIGRNPKTGISCIIAARKSVKFRPGKLLLDALNKK